MSVNTTYKAKKYLLFKMGQIRDDGVSYMKSVAPHPTGASRGKGSMSTGALKASITGRRSGLWSVVIEPNKEYDIYAENGRGSIIKPYRMRFIGSDGNVHYAHYVAGMKGWHFAAKTAAYLRAKYGG